MFGRQPTLTATDIEHIVRRYLTPLYKLMEKIMSKTDDQAAAIAANTAMITQIGASLTAVMNGHATLQEEIDALKAANPAVDFTPVDNAIAAQTTALQAVTAMVTPAPAPAAPAAPTA